MKLILLYLILSLLIPSTVLSRVGGHDGGGGQGLVCYNDQGGIESVELLDFYEGSILDSLDIREYEGGAIEIARDRFQQFYLEESYLTLLEYIYKSFHLLPTGVRLNQINDGNVIYVPQKCRLEQVANFQGLNRVFVVKDFWDKMTPTHQAGLIMHEFLWYKERTQAIPHSARVKRNVARMFSTNFDLEVQSSLASIPLLSCWNSEVPYTYFRIKRNFDLHFDLLAGELNFIQYSLQEGLSLKDKQMLAAVLMNPGSVYVEYGDGWENEITSRTFELLLKTSQGKVIVALNIHWDSQASQKLLMDLHHYEYQSLSQQRTGFECFGIN